MGVPLDLNQSPFNVGLPIQLNNFSVKQVLQLAQIYRVQQTESEIERLMSLVGGHPALINLALYHLSHQEITLNRLLKTAGDAKGIYAHHLQRHWVALQKQPELLQALAEVLNADESIILDPIQAYKLCSLGLIEMEEGKVILRCQLYRRYFSEQSSGIKDKT